MKQYFVYIIQCADKSYYTGITNDLERRLYEHNEGISKKAYTYNRRPLELKYYEVFQNPTQAIDHEKQIKGWTRKKKEALINNNWDKLKELAICKNNTHSSKKKPDL